MSLVSVLEDIEKYREANASLAEKIPLAKVSHFDAAREIDGLLKRCKFIGECLSEFEKVSIEDCQRDLLRAKIEIEYFRIERDQALRQCETIKEKCLGLLKEKEKTVASLKSRNSELREEVNQLSGHRKELRERLQQKERDIQSLKYRTRIKDPPSGPTNPSKRR